MILKTIQIADSWIFILSWLFFSYVASFINIIILKKNHANIFCLSIHLLVTELLALNLWASKMLTDWQVFLFLYCFQGRSWQQDTRACRGKYHARKILKGTLFSAILRSFDFSSLCKYLWSIMYMWNFVNTYKHTVTLIFKFAYMNVCIYTYICWQVYLCKWTYLYIIWR